MNLTVSSLTSGAATAASNLIDLSSSAGNSVTVTALGGNVSNSNGVIVTGSSTTPRANLIVKNTTSYGFASLSGGATGTLQPLTTGTTLDAATAFTNTQNLRLTAAGTLTRTAALDFATLTIDSNAGPVTLDMGANDILTSSTTARGLLVSGSNDVAISGTGKFAASSVFIYHYGTGVLSLGLTSATSATIFGGTGFYDYSGVLVNGGTGTTISGPLFRISTAQNVVNLNAAPFYVSGGGVLEIGADLNGATAGDFSNPVGTANGAIRFQGDSGISANGATRVVNFGGANAPLTWGANAFLTNADSVTDGGYKLKLSSTRSDATVEISNPINLGGRARVIEVANGSAAIDARLTGVLSGETSLTKIGTGTLVITATNTFTGPTNVNAGALAVNGSTVASSATNVNAGGTLMGSGTVGATFINAGGTIAPGNSPGVLNVASGLTLGAGSLYSWEHSAGNAVGTLGTSFDSINVTFGSTTISSTPSTGAKLDLRFDATTDFSNAFWNTAQSWNIITGGLTAGNIFDTSNLAIFVNNVATGSGNTISGQGSFQTVVSGSNLQLNWMPTAVVGNPVLAASVTAGNATFGNVLKGASATATVTLTNSGGDTTSITGNTVTGFTVGATGTQTLLGGGTTTSTVTLNTSAYGTFGGNVVYTAQPGNVASTPAIAVSGTVGNAPAARVTGNPVNVSNASNYGPTLKAEVVAAANATTSLPTGLESRVFTTTGVGNATAFNGTGSFSTATLVMGNLVNGTASPVTSTIEMSWRTRTDLEVAGNFTTQAPLLSDVVKVTGLDNQIFVLQMNYNDLLFGTNEGLSASLGALKLAWYDTVNQSWLNAVAGNHGAGRRERANASGVELPGLRHRPCVRSVPGQQRQPRPLSRQLGLRHDQQHGLGGVEPQQRLRRHPRTQLPGLRRTRPPRTRRTRPPTSSSQSQIGLNATSVAKTPTRRASQRRLSGKFDAAQPPPIATAIGGGFLRRHRTRNIERRSYARYIEHYANR
ncbi:MAG: autotransporter-associated beta strand repeat-containing protein [Pirellulales bacterium]